MAHREITQLLLRWSQGDKGAADALFPLVYNELRRLARGQRRRARVGDTLGTTAVVHEAYLKLIDARQVSVRDRQHFLALAARVMRQVLVNEAHRQRAAKRGGGAHRTGIDTNVAAESQSFEILALDEALTRLQALEPRLVEIVELRFFAGLSVRETAEALALAPRTVDRDWARARAFLHGELRSASGDQQR